MFLYKYILIAPSSLVCVCLCTVRVCLLTGPASCASMKAQSTAVTSTPCLPSPCFCVCIRKSIWVFCEVLRMSGLASGKSKGY